MPRKPREIAMSSTQLALAVVSLAAIAPSHGCVHFLEPCPGRSVHAGDTLACSAPGWTDRSFDLQLPWRWDGSSRLPLLVVIHGGGGNKHAAASVTCPGGDGGNPSCLPILARGKGFAVVLPDGTGTRPLRNIRTWNAGGGTKGYQCTSGGACASGIDDIRYFRDLLGEIRKTIPVDDRRVFATGISNGGAMAHRVACQLPDQFAAIVAVGGGNQFAAAGGRCEAPMPVLQIHGTDDPCWTYEQSDETCIRGAGTGVKVGVSQSMELWRDINGCSNDTTDVDIDDRTSDGTTSVRRKWKDCTAALELIRVNGGGHTWPNGHAYLDRDRIGRVERDFGSDLILEFFLAHPKP